MLCSRNIKGKINWLWLADCHYRCSSFIYYYHSSVRKQCLSYSPRSQVQARPALHPRVTLQVTRPACGQRRDVLRLQLTTSVKSAIFKVSAAADLTPEAAAVWTGDPGPRSPVPCPRSLVPVPGPGPGPHLVRAVRTTAPLAAAG